MQKSYGVSKGIGIGVAVHIIPTAPIRNRRFTTPEKEAIAIQDAAAQFATYAETLAQTLTEKANAAVAKILRTQVLLLQDPLLQQELSKKLAEGCCAEQAVQIVCNSYATLLEQMPDEAMVQRGADLRDVCDQVCAILQGDPPPDWANLVSECVLIADEFTPSLTAGLPCEKVVGLIARRGGTTSHAAILARALGIPAVLGFDAPLARIPKDALVALDGSTGAVFVNPSAATLQFFRAKQTEQLEQKDIASRYKKPVCTIDGIKVKVMANISTLQELQAVIACGAQGVGLVRTEQLFLESGRLPTKEEQSAWYIQAAASLQPEPVVVRTLDISGEKSVPYLHVRKERNPFLGCRGIRHSLANPDIFRTQIRAMLCAAAITSNLRILLPMVADMRQLRAAKAYIAQEEEDLRTKGVTFARSVRVGVLIETPAAAMLAPQLAKEVDFFSIGSNDLCQYFLAADRANPSVHINNACMHPAVLQAFRHIVGAGIQAGLNVYMSGEAAADIRMLPLLLAWGISGLSVSPHAIAPLRKAITRWDFPSAHCLEKQVMALDTIPEIAACLEKAKEERDLMVQSVCI